MVQHINLLFLFLTSYFAMSPRDIRGGIGYRYVGFYGSLIKTVLKNSKAEVFWYSHSDQKLIVISSGKVSIKKKTMLEAILSAILTTLKKQKRLIVIIAFPYATHPPPVTFGYLFSLMILSLVKIFVPNKIKVIIDDIDPPVEALYAFSEKEPPVLSVIFNRGIELLTLKLSSIILVHTMSFKLYLAKIYRLRKDKIWIVPCGALVQYIKYVPPKAKGPITILYSGSLMSVKNIDKLISAVEDLRREGLQISLVITGSIVDVIPPKWVTHRYVKDYLTYVKDVLEKADICVIPYPNTKLFWNYTLLTNRRIHGCWQTRDIYQTKRSK